MNETKHQVATRPNRVAMVKWALAALALIYVVIFVVQNRDEVSIDFVFFTSTTSLVVALVLVGVLGMLLGWLLSALSRRGD